MFDIFGMSLYCIYIMHNQSFSSDNKCEPKTITNEPQYVFENVIFHHEDGHIYL